ncbi:MAG: TRAP transporter substrate-binding protein DctP [Firmicutes bacterium]|nr:TRAP transporter substrate-binding protein DctP [Bacillota bacterium]
MKKIIAIILILALIFTFVACGDKPEGNNGEENGESQSQENGEETKEEESEQEQTNPINGLAGNTYELSLGSVQSVPVNEGVVKLCDLVEEYSTGTLVIKEITEDTPTDDAKKLRKVMDGELDIAIGRSDGFASIIKDLHLFDVYYLFQSKEEVYNVALSSEVIDALEASFEKKGLKCLSLWGNGFDELTVNKKKVI